MYEKTQSMSWAFIIIALILFSPIGAFLLYRKIKEDRCAAINNGNIVIAVSYIPLVFFAAYLALTVTDGFFFLVPAVLAGAGGLWVNSMGRRMKETGTGYKQYINLIVNQGQTSIDDIAAAMGRSNHLAVQDLQTMIQQGFFRDAELDTEKRKIVLVRAMPSFTPAEQTEEILTCKGCGANHRLFLPSVDCEYCGSSLAQE